MLQRRDRRPLGAAPAGGSAAEAAAARCFGDHPLQPPVELIQARRGSEFTAFDGNLCCPQRPGSAAAGGSISPSALETFATCGMRYFFGQVLRLRPVDEPEESQTMGAAEKGSLVHRVLQRFFEEQHTRRTPCTQRTLDADDWTRLLASLSKSSRRSAQGRAGLDIYMDHDRN